MGEAGAGGADPFRGVDRGRKARHAAFLGMREDKSARGTSRIVLRATSLRPDPQTARPRAPLARRCAERPNPTRRRRLLLRDPSHCDIAQSDPIVAVGVHPAAARTRSSTQHGGDSRGRQHHGRNYQFLGFDRNNNFINVLSSWQLTMQRLRYNTAPAPFFSRSPRSDSLDEPRGQPMATRPMQQEFTHV